MRLEIDKIRFRNFLSFGSKWQEVEFVSGLNLILGIDHAKDRSNASGKSSFLETVPFAFFGKVNRNINKDQIVNWKNRKECEVSISFTKNNDEYLIHRAIKPDNLEATKNGTPIPMDSDKRIFQKHLEEEILGIDFNTFMSLIYTNINSTVPVLTMKKPEKRKFLERIFNLKLFNKVNEKANEKLRSIDKKTNEIDMKRQFNERSIEASHDKIKDLVQRMRKLASSESDLEDAKDRYKKLTEKHSEEVKRYENIKNDIAALEKDQVYYSSIVSNIDTKIESVKSRIKTIEKHIDKDKVKHELGLLNNLKEERKSYGDPQGLEKAIKESENEILEIEKERDKCIVREVEYQKELSSLEAIIKQDEEHLEVMETEDSCPLCGEKITNEKIDELKKKLKINRAKYTRAKNGSIDAMHQAETIKKEINTRLESKNDMRETLLTILNLDRDIEAKTNFLKSLDIKKQKNLIKRLNNALEKLDIAGNKYGNIIKTINRDLKKLEDEWTELSKTMNSIESLERKIEDLEERIKEEEKTKDSFQEMVDSEKAKIETLSKENETLQAEREKYQLIEDYIKYIKICCKDENIKQYVISSNMPYLNKQANHYLSYQGHGFYAIIDKWLEAEIKGPGITNASYGNLSGGESRSIDLSLQMALLDYARLKAGIFPDILITDELLDSSIDSYGLERVMKIVKGKQLEDNLKIFLISHRKEVEDIDVDRVYLVEKSGGYSKVNLQ